MKGTLSILGMLEEHPTLLDDLQYPAALDEDTLKSNIIIECAELEVLYSDPEFFQTAIKYWSKAELPTWQKIYDLSVLEYNPIENYDRLEEETENGTGSRATENSGNSRGTSTDRNSTNNYVYGFNSSSDVPHDRSQQDGYNENSQNVSNTGNETATDNRTRNSHIHGNIGVTTSQQMIESSLELEPKLNLINYIVSAFKCRFCLLVY